MLGRNAINLLIAMSLVACGGKGEPEVQTRTHTKEIVNCTLKEYENETIIICPDGTESIVHTTEIRETTEYKEPLIIYAGQFCRRITVQIGNDFYVDDGFLKRITEVPHEIRRGCFVKLEEGEVVEYETE